MLENWLKMSLLGYIPLLNNPWNNPFFLVMEASFFQHFKTNLPKKLSQAVGRQGALHGNLGVRFSLKAASTPSNSLVCASTTAEGG